MAILLSAQMADISEIDLNNSGFPDKAFGNHSD